MDSDARPEGGRLNALNAQSGKAVAERMAGLGVSW